jgi:hypothetical protein
MRLLSRPVTLLMMLGACVVVPYAVGNHSGILDKLSPSGDAVRGSLPPSAPGEDPLLATSDPLAVLYTSSKPLQGPPAVHLEEVFRFDINREWVFSRWPRKSLVPGDDSLIGVRVPLVSGMAIDDLAGSLTYYFDPAGQVQHIAFQGRTGDPQRLIRLIAGRFGLWPQEPAMPGEHLYQSRWNGRPQSELRIRPAAVVWSSSPHSTFDVELALERPGSNRFLR